MTAERAERIERIAALIISLILFGALIARLTLVGPLWRDEISTLKLATMPSIPAMWRQLFIDPFPMLFFLVLRGWHALVGDDDFSLRILGCSIAVATVAALWIAARCTGRRTPLLALLLFGFCPTFIIWASTLRGYGLAVFWSVLVFAFFWRMLERTTLTNFAIATLVSIAAVQTAYTASFNVFACGCAAAIAGAAARNGRGVFASLGAGALAAASLLPYVSVLHTATPWASAYRIHYTLGDSLVMLGAAFTGPTRVLFWLWVICAPGACIIAMWRIRISTAKDDRSSVLYAVSAGVLSFASTMIFFQAVGWGTNVWYYLPMLTVAGLAIDVCLRWPHSPRITLARTAIIIVAFIAWMPIVWLIIPLRVSNVDLAARVFAQNAAPGDLMVISPSVEASTFERYYRGTAEWVAFPPQRHFPISASEDLLAEMRQPNAIAPLLSRIEQKLKSGEHVWFESVWVAPPPSRSPPEIVPLHESDTRPASHFFRAWHETLFHFFRNHAAQLQAVQLPNTQPVAPYEDARVYRFTGWHD